MIPVFQGMFSVSIGAPFFLMVGICIVLALITAFAFKAHPEQAGAYPANIPVSAEESAEAIRKLTENKSTLTIGQLLKNRNFWLICLIFGFLLMGLVGTFAQLIPRMCSVGLAPNTAIFWCSLACIIGGLGNLMPSVIIQVFGRYGFHQANKIIVPVVIGIRSFALIIVSAVLSAAGANVNQGYGNVFVIFAVLSVLAVIMSALVKDPAKATKNP